MKRLGFAFTEDDVALLKRLQAKLGELMGPVSYIGVIRWALREAEKASK